MEVHDGDVECGVTGKPLIIELGGAQLLLDVDAVIWGGREGNMMNNKIPM